MKPTELATLEMRLLVEGIQAVWGHDFRNYAESSLKRRMGHWLAESGYRTFSEAQSKLLRDRRLFESLLQAITVNVTEMFRDPPFFRALREHVVPVLRTYPFIKIWHAGCASGEEAYSLAIVMHEEGLSGRYRMYATDINELVLRRAASGMVATADMQKHTRNYQQSGGRASFADYYKVGAGGTALMPELLRDIVFAPHNLAVDQEFGEMHLVLCRNVMIYFKPALKARCFGLFDSSLVPGGFLCLGLKETLVATDLPPQCARYEEIAPRMRIYRKAYPHSLHSRHARA